jgi:ABC-2 type transport system permease protein
MSLRSLLRKEVYWSRRNALVLLLILLVLPGFFAASSVVFEDVIPRDTPVAVVPQSEDVTAQELFLAQVGTSEYSDPQVVTDTQTALRQLEREQVYAVVEVPHGIRDTGTSVTVRLYVDGSMIPYKEPSATIANIVEGQLDRSLDADITVERVVVGNDHDLSAYLLPIALMGLLMLVALTYVPYNLAGEAPAMDRIRLESSIEALVGAKLVFFTALMLVPIVVFQGAIVGVDALSTVDYSAVSAVAPGAVLALLLTFVTLAALSMAVMVATGFGTTGRFVNVLLLLGVVGFSGLAYPVGYFSPLRRELTRAMPTHYATIVTRSGMLRGSTVEAYATWLAGLALVAVLALVVLKLTIVATRRWVT